MTSNWALRPFQNDTGRRPKVRPQGRLSVQEVCSDTGFHEFFRWLSRSKV